MPRACISFREEWKFMFMEVVEGTLWKGPKRLSGQQLKLTCNTELPVFFQLSLLLLFL